LSSVEKFLQSDYAYFTESGYFENELNDLSNLVHDSWACVFAWVEGKFRSIVVRQTAIEESRRAENEVLASPAIS
jgi:hypothetical protein